MQALVSSCSCSGHAGVEGDHLRCWQDHHVAARGDEQQAAALAALAIMASVHRPHFTQLIAPSVRNRHSLSEAVTRAAHTSMPNWCHAPARNVVRAALCTTCCETFRTSAPSSFLFADGSTSCSASKPEVCWGAENSTIWSPGVQQQPVHHALPAVTLFVTATSCT